MDIRLPNNYRIQQLDEYNFQLTHSYTSYGSGDNVSEAPKTVTKSLGYFRSVEEATKRYIKEVVKEGTQDFDGTLEEYVKRVANITDNAVKEVLRLTQKGTKK